MDKEKFWERQYQRNVGRIIAVCYRYVNDRAVAEDLAQDVFVKAMEKFTTIPAPDTPRHHHPKGSRPPDDCHPRHHYNFRHNIPQL